MIDCCAKREQEIPDFNDMVIVVVPEDDRIWTNVQCIINIDSDPANSQLMEFIKNVDLKEQNSLKKQYLDKPIKCVLGSWHMQEFRLENIRYIAHLKIDNTLTRDKLHTLYQDLFIQLRKKVIRTIYFPQHWVDYSSVSMTENAQSLFEQILVCKNKDEKSVVDYATVKGKFMMVIDYVDK